MPLLDQIIIPAMLKARILHAGETPNGTEGADALLVLNQMLDAWNTDRLNIFTVGQGTYALTGAVQKYAIGPTAGAPFNVNRPVLIQSAAIVVPGTTIRERMDIYTSARWAAIKELGLTGVLPDKLYCDYAAPNANLYVHPIPSGTPTIEIYSWSALAAFVTLQDLIAFPPGYIEAIIYNLAIKLAPEYGQQADQLVIVTAQSSKQAMRDLNQQMLRDAAGDSAVGQLPVIGEPLPQQMPMVQQPQQQQPGQPQ